MTTHGYPSDLTDELWKLIEPMIPPAKPGGRPRTTNVRKPSPSAAVIDSQSVKTVEKGGRGDTTPARKSAAASVISS